MKKLFRVRTVSCSTSSVAHIALDSPADPYESHFGPSSSDLSEARCQTVKSKLWKISRSQYGKLGGAIDYAPEIEGNILEKRGKPAVRILL